MENGSQSNGASDDKENKKHCDPCQKQGKIILGLYHCFSCHEMYCEECKVYHGNFKATADHKLAEVKVLPDDIKREEVLVDFMKCAQHPNANLDFVGKDDGELVCKVCAKTAGKSFDEVDIISSLDIDEEQLNQDIPELKNRLDAAKEHLNLLQKIRKDGKQDMKLCLKRINDNVKNMQKQVNQLMEKLVQHVAGITKQIQDDIKRRVDQDSSRVEEILKKPSNGAHLLDTVTRYGSVRHKFIATKYIKKQMKETDKLIANEDDELKRYDVELKLASNLTKLLENTDVSKLAQVTVNEQKNGYAIRQEFNLDTKDWKLEHIGEHRTRPQCLEDCSPSYTGIAVHKDGRLILCDSCDFQSNTSCGFLCLFDTTCHSMVKLKMNKPFSAVPIDQSHVVVSIPRDKTICVVSTEGELRIERTLHTEHEPISIAALNNHQLAVAWNHPPAFGVVDISGQDLLEQSYFVEDTSGRQFRSFDYLAVDERKSHVIQVCQEDNAVYCFDLSGQPVFKYTDEELITPRGVAVDKFGNVFICNYDNESLHMCSSDGKKVKVFREGVPLQPLAVCIDKSTGKVYVTDYTRFDKITCYKLH